MRERTEPTETTKDGRTTRFEKSRPGLARLPQINGVRFNDGRFRVTTEAQLPARARFVFTGHWPLEAWGVGTLPR